MQDLRDHFQEFIHRDRFSENLVDAAFGGLS
jgi:hypothetical protein